MARSPPATEGEEVTNPFGLYTKNRNSMDAERSNRYCAHNVHDAFGVGFHQCDRKPSVDLFGFRWCKQHAKIVARRNSELAP